MHVHPNEFSTGTRSRLVSLAAVVVAGLMAGCETAPTAAAPRAQQGATFVQSSYQIPVAVPGLNGRYDRTRSGARQQVIVTPGEPATFRMQVDVRRPARGAELRVFSGGQQLIAVPAVAMRPGDPAIPLVVGLPVDPKRQILDIRVELHPAVAEAAFEVGAASVTIGEVAPEQLRVE